ncbi:hypothetical protein TCAL_06453 [Tigriopus californicus]|uniref:L1 transposable element RRM domain-containing protein n=1 Tax=Tigriopus californicus TaxID=6832 RepID=A0A553PLP1_TIGCA|nr:uncharacterized protein LOC131890264 isoform X2 [Tigriopus californicus]TRY78601.1 hypothetical protein TCAL_06453 [Tigriopus californicus]
MKEIQHVKRSANGADHNEMNHSSSQDFSQIIQAQHELLSEQGRQIHELKVKLDNNLKLTDGLQTQIEEMQDAFQEWREREKSVSGSSSTTITNNDDLSVTTGLQEQIDRLTSAYNGIQDQLYEIDKSWKNNLILYGLPYSDSMDEDPLILEERVRDIFHKKLHISRDMAIHRITRLWYGPDCRGYKPIQIAFSQYKDKEEVLRKARLLKGGSIYLSEDFSRKVRQHRHELIKFMKEVKSRDPARRMVLRYDKLYIGT